MVDGIRGVAEWLAHEASAVLSLVDTGDLVEANRKIVADNRDMLPSLLDLQSEFMGMSTAI